MSTPSHAQPPRRASLRRFLQVRPTRAQAIIGVICALVGLGLVTQVRQQAGAQYADLRQDELVQVLDQLTTRSDELARQQQELETSIEELKSGADQQQAAAQAAAEQAKINEVLAGTVPVQGPGVVVSVVDPQNNAKASLYLHLLEELRNAGAEAIEVNGHRIGTRSWVADGAGGIIVDGVQLTQPYRWAAIGDPQTVDGALSIPGGATQSLKSAGANATVTDETELRIASTVTNPDPVYAKPPST